MLVSADGATLNNLTKGFAEAQLRHDQSATAPYANAIFAGAADSIHLVLRGTPFQLKVWQAFCNDSFNPRTIRWHKRNRP